ncbi:hypothetical protein FP2506_17209 [Fulvimarina pelagi HTCC2506]|uniref:Autotransporter domain-containing protein n=2 Tax=Fulvimarina pelagi TaxID=217511 RepID=Q0G2I8_9HYPH|nr:autotransporter domain-containing protein [Fulvimarina pelagi]EAU42193.1 hypothetical protein FP2506_17209 [Fulvimarina pelagi HTCC2506]
MGSSIINSGTIRETSGAGDAILFDYGEDDRLELQPGSVIEGFVRAGAGTDTLAFGGNSGTFNFDISSVDGNNTDDGEQYLAFENFEKVGAATTNLTGTNTEITDFAVNGGLLNVNGSMPNTTFAVDGGVLGGAGTIGSFVANSGGTVAPGNSIGTLNVAGNATFQPGSVYEVEIAADGTGDRVSADTATINGGTVDVVTLDPYTAYTDGQRYTIVSTANGRTGTFDSLQDDSVFLDYNLLYTSNDIILELIQALQFPDVARTFNQRQTANALMQLDQTPGSASNGLYNVLLMLDAPTARDAFDQLSGEPHASMKTVLIQDSRFVRDAAQDRINGAFGMNGGGDMVQPLGFGPGVPVIAGSGGADVEAWTRFYGAWSDVDGDGNAAAADTDTSGFFVGVDGMVSDTVKLGVLGGYSSTDLDVDARNANGSTESWHLGLYAGTELYGLIVKGGAAYAWHEIDMVRSVSFPGFSDTLVSEYDAGTGQVFGEVSYDLALATATISPFAGLAYVHHRTDRFTETGGAAALTASGIDLDTWFSEIGVRGSMLVGTDLSLRGEAGWRHAFEDTTTLEAFRFATSPAYLVKGVSIDEDVGFIEVGADYRLNEWATVGAAYEGQYGRDTTSNSARADLTFRF